MAIDIQPPNLSGLTAIAGKNAPLNIQPTGALGLQALQQQQANAASLRANDLARMQLQQQGQLGLLSNQTQQRALDLQALQQQNQKAFQQGELGLKQQQLGMQGNQFDSEMGLKQQQLAQQTLEQQNELDLKNRILAETTAKNQMAKLLAENKQIIQDKGAFASYGLMSMKGAQTPEESNQIRMEIVKEALAKKYMTADEAKAALTLPISQFTNGLAYKVMQFGQAKEYKDMMEANKPSQPGTHLTIGPDGTINYTQDLSKPNQTQAQKDIMGNADNVNELKKLYSSVPDEFFGASALGQPVTKIREWAENVPIIGKALGPSEDAKRSLENYSGLQGTANMLSMNIIKQLSGVQYSDKQLEFMNKILPQFGPGTVKSEFKGRTENLLRFFDEVKKNREQLLKAGIPVGSPEYNDKMLSTMQNVAASVSGGGDQELFNQYRQDPAYTSWSDDKIKRAIKMLKGQ